MPDIQIDPEFRSLIPTLLPEERKRLELNILADGCREPLVIWNGLLLDGHNRYEICIANGVDFGTVSNHSADRDAAKVWIIQNQFGRRNLSAYQRAELALQLEPLIAARAKERQGARTDLLPEVAKGSPINTRAEVAKLAGVGREMIRMAKVIRDEAPEELREQVRRGEVSVSRAHHTLRPTAARPADGPRLKPAATRPSPDFSRLSPNAAAPVRPMENANVIPVFTVNLPRDPARGAQVILQMFGVDYARALANEILKGIE